MDEQESPLLSSQVGEEYIHINRMVQLATSPFASGTCQRFQKAVLYQVDLEMVDLTNNVKAWFGQKKIKKVVDRKRVVF